MKEIPLSKSCPDLLYKYNLNSIPQSVLRCYLYQSEELIVREGMDASDLKIVVRGKAKACKYAKNGKSLILSYWINGGIIGEAELVSQSKAIQNSVIAITEVECISIPMETCLAVFKTNVGFSNRIATELVKKLNADSKIIFTGMYNAKQRLCAYILETAYDGIFREPLTDTAVSIGVTYRHLLRMLSDLCKEKILLKDSAGYHINDKARLEALAGNILFD